MHTFIPNCIRLCADQTVIRCDLSNGVSAGMVSYFFVEDYDDDDDEEEEEETK
jgi:hypothetical protein